MNSDKILVSKDIIEFILYEAAMTGGEVWFGWGETDELERLTDEFYGPDKLPNEHTFDRIKRRADEEAKNTA